MVDGKAAGIVVRDLLTGEVTSHSAHAVVLATGGYSNVFFLSTNAMACNVTAAWRAHRKGAAFANPCYTQIHPTCIPQSDDFQSKLTLMSESLRNDGRIWCPKDPDETRPPEQIPEEDRDYYLERRYPSFGNLAPRDIASRAAKVVVDEGKGVGPLKNGVYLDFADAIDRLGEGVIRERYGNLFEMYERITDESPYKQPDAHLPRRPLHDGRALGGLRADDHRARPLRHRRGQLQRPRRQPPRRLGPDAGPGRRLLRAAQHDQQLPGPAARHPAGAHRPPRVPGGRGRRRASASPATSPSAAPARPTPSTSELGRIMWDYCGMERTKEGLEKALSEIPALHEEFRKDLRVTGTGEATNQTLEKAGRVDDFFELAQVMCLDALTREESCGGHFRAEHQTDEGEAERDDEHFAHVAAWEWTGDPANPTRHVEPLEFDDVHLAVRSYK